MNWKKFTLNNIYIVLSLSLVLYLKLLLIPYESTDYVEDLDVWCAAILKGGYMHAFSERFSNYPPLYVYYLVLITKLLHPTEWIIGIKLLSILFDFVLAYFSFKIILHCSQNKQWSMLGGCLIFALPTVILNSALWGQCDSIYGAMIIASIYYLLTTKVTPAFLFLGIAFSLKLQTVFIFPLLILLYFSKPEIKVWHFLFLPVLFFLSVVPAWIFGGNLGELLLTYVDQADAYKMLSFNAPSVYALFPNIYFVFKTAGILFALLITGTLLYLYFLYPFILTNETILHFCFFFTGLVPYILPGMHERYYFLADIFSVIYCFSRKGKFHYALFIQVISLFSYFPFLLGHSVIESKYVSIFLGILLYYLFREIYKPTLDTIRKT